MRYKYSIIFPLIHQLHNSSTLDIVNSIWQWLHTKKKNRLIYNLNNNCLWQSAFGMKCHSKLHTRISPVSPSIFDILLFNISQGEYLLEMSGDKIKLCTAKQTTHSNSAKTVQFDFSRLRYINTRRKLHIRIHNNILYSNVSVLDKFKRLSSVFLEHTKILNS